jgi:hypothetical protein
MAGKLSKLLTGLNFPKAGPTFPKDEAAPPTEVIKSSPIIPKTNEPIENTNKYNIKKAKILNTISCEMDLLLNLTGTIALG